MSPASLRALLAQSIDYAGLFPPADLELEPALRNHAQYVRSPDAWMLGAFVLPWKKFPDVAPHLAHFDERNRLCVSALGPKTDTAAEFLSALNAGADVLRAFEAEHGSAVKIAQIEMALPASAGASLAETNRALAGLEIPAFWEAPVDEAERTIAFLAERKSTGAGRFGFKLRTGGVVASAFPSAIQIARALVAAVKYGVPIKFTAGLHHPVRLFHSSVQTKMHGFFNVLGAGVMAAEHGWNVQQTAAMLEDEDASEFIFDDQAFVWREWRITTARIAAQRKLITSLGSCSFDEPRDDLRALNLF